MDIPAQAHAHPQGGWPGNELEEVLGGLPRGARTAGGRIVEVLGRSHVWVPLPNGGGPDSRRRSTCPRWRSRARRTSPSSAPSSSSCSCVGAHMSFTVAPAVEFARGLPPQLGIAVNPDGAVGVPLPPPAVAELCRAGRTPLDGPASGGRVRLYEPDWQEDPSTSWPPRPASSRRPVSCCTARRCLASIEGGDPVLFIGVELSTWDGAGRNAPMDALGRALGRVPVPWPVNLVLLDVAQDPVADWMRARIRPFYQREGH